VSEEITMQEWEEYFMKVLEGRKEEGKEEGKAETDIKRKQTVPEETEITVEEGEKQIRHLKKRKATGRDVVQNEAWMYGTEGTVETIVELINGVRGRLGRGSNLSYL
jgi:hypothetical protein